MIPLSPARQNTKIGQPIAVSASTGWLAIITSPQYAIVPYTEAMQVGQSMTGLANSGNCEMNRQRRSSNIIPSAEESHRPKMNSEVKRSVVMVVIVYCG